MRICIRIYPLLSGDEYGSKMKNGILARFGNEDKFLLWRWNGIMIHVLTPCYP